MAWRCGGWLLLACVVSPVVAQAATPACAVWQRELSFARSVQQHDAAAFAGYLMADAIFDANAPQPTRGRAAILQHWSAMIAGKSVRLDWYPQQVVTSSDGKLAYSSGPYLFENLAAGAKRRYTIGRFATTWRHATDGAWRVAFDAGDHGKAASEAEAAAFRAARVELCPGNSVAELPVIRH
ncbi:YybH family protein [Rhodanobacter ginsengiterrae]|uniref:YybH family protein n=1 Tax=Rhodanobacter ginsengiterrae TaxID=2008451 RepID=UPI003CEFC700